jgi:four helix bundle protein
LVQSLASNDETIYHLEVLFETESLTDKELYEKLLDQAMHLGSMLNRFIDRLEK